MAIRKKKSGAQPPPAPARVRPTPASRPRPSSVSRPDAAPRHGGAAASAAASRKTAAPKVPKAQANAGAAKSSARATISGPAARPAPAGIVDAATAKLAGTEMLAADFPDNAAKPSEYSDPPVPAVGQHGEPAAPLVSASTLTEGNASPKVGSGNPSLGFNPAPHHWIGSASIPAAARSRRTRACRSPTTRTRSRPVCAGRRCSRISSFARRSLTSITSAFPSASCTRAARPRTATSSATSR